jgi:Fe2+ or Zn2+ uptake regulation protein
VNARRTQTADHDPDDAPASDHPASAADEIHAAVAARLGTHDVRYTRTRRAVIDVLAQTRQPLTVDQIRDKTAAPLSSVYRTLTILEQTELVHRLTNDNSEYAHYELAEQLLGHHHHLACANCGTMTDVTLPTQLEADLDDALGLLATQQRFTLDSHRLDIIGTCASCADPVAGAHSE